jgi:hypothetical protein
VTREEQASRLLLLFLDFDNFATPVVAAFGANGVLACHLAAIRAGYERDRRHGILRAAAVTATLRVFALWVWGHAILLLDSQR